MRCRATTFTGPPVAAAHPNRDLWPCSGRLPSSTIALWTSLRRKAQTSALSGGSWTIWPLPGLSTVGTEPTNVATRGYANSRARSSALSRSFSHTRAVAVVRPGHRPVARARTSGQRHDAGRHRHLPRDSDSIAPRSRQKGCRLRRSRTAVLATARRHGASNVRVFGSVARGEDGPESDVDLVVDLAPGTGLVGWATLERELAQVLGTWVDVAPSDSLRPVVRDAIDAEAIPL